MFYVYFLTNKTNAVLYIGVTNDIRRRIYEHQSDLVDGFTKRYQAHKFVHVEEYSNASDAIEREKQLKRWVRAKKNSLIERINPNWDDLSDTL